MIPKDQPTADKRAISRILSLSHGVSKPDPKLMEIISRVYQQKGGRWSKFFEGNPTHSKLLKQVIKVVLKRSRDE